MSTVWVLAVCGLALGSALADSIPGDARRGEELFRGVMEMARVRAGWLSFQRLSFPSSMSVILIFRRAPGLRRKRRRRRDTRHSSHRT